MINDAFDARVDVLEPFVFDPSFLEAPCDGGQMS